MAKKAAKKATKKAAAKSCGTKKCASPKEVLVVASKVKAYVRSKGCMCSSDAIQAISDSLYCALDKALQRVEANRRSTLKPQDI